ncbi:hypothetical protein [Bradyrhizobium sp. CCBAU 53380]|uniref:hypothetical protein n=1 Tax=Bradyrhizobium sp. CCBAU 53380 TaxID=1325117 RepID=UPI002302ED89|nr:hypothetical protein [Bradyrhizobium sp. CCBAU 53380]MDA9426227.1 hypothetical protein [Bradyrhizobium sp. CCBAU 53380]
MAPDKRVELLAGLHWRMAASPDGGCVLPDCIALAEDDDQGLKPLIFADVAKLQTVCMPVSPDRLLVGFRTPVTRINLSDFNTAAAAASQSFFIANSRTDHFARLSGQIGSYVGRFVDWTIRQAFDGFVADRRATISSAADTHEPTVTS